MIKFMPFIKELLDGYTFSATKYIEDDNSVTLSLSEKDLIENGETEEKAKKTSHQYF